MKREQRKRIGIILVNYKDYAIKYLPACRDCLRQQTYPSDLFQVYIVDNASSSESLEYLRKTYPEAKILSRLDGNYVAANNLGFKEAIKAGSDYLVTVNMDTEMEKDWLSELVFALDEQKNAGIAQSKILLYSQNRLETRINSLGNIIHFLGFGFTSAYGQKDREIQAYPEIKGYASGCSFIVRKEVFEGLGGYNEEYYMYHDDLEFSLRAKLAGYRIVLAPKSRIYHKYKFSRSVKMLYYMERNRHITMMTFYSSRFLALIFIPCLVLELGLLIFSIFKSWFKTELKVYSYFLNIHTWKIIFRERRRIAKITVTPFGNLAKDFSGKIEFQEITNPILKYLINPAFNLYWRLVKKII